MPVTEKQPLLGKGAAIDAESLQKDEKGNKGFGRRMLATIRQAIATGKKSAQSDTGLAAGYVLLWFGVGIVIGCVIEGWQLSTAIYVMIQIVTTIGYGDITVENPAMKIFMSIYVLVGLLVVANIFTNFADSILKAQSGKFRKMLRVAEAKMSTDNETEKQEKQKFGAMNKLAASAFLFFIFVLLGTAFYAIFESCSCSYGKTAIKGCVEGPKCVTTGGAIKTWNDSVYMAVITLTTVGFGDFSPKSEIGRAFGCWWMLLGVCATANFVSNFSSHFLTQQRKKRRVERMSRGLFDSIDTDKSGHLAKDEFRTYMLLKFEICTEEDLDGIDQIFRQMDKDKSGHVSYEEIVEYVDDAANQEE